MKIHTGDTVIVITGKDKGKQGAIMRVLPEKNRVVVEGINMRVRHIRKTAQQAGSRITYEASLHASNVMIIDPKTKKPTRIGYKTDPKTGKKARFSILSGEILPLVVKAKIEKKVKKSDTKPVVEKKAKSEVAIEKVQGPAKQPFWKRAFSGAGPEDQDESAGRNRQEEIDKGSVASVRRSRESS